MSTRLATGGRLLNKSKALSFSFNGTTLKGFEGDTLASALLANDRVLMGLRASKPKAKTTGPALNMTWAR